MAPWLLLSLSLAQSSDPTAASDAQRTQEQALQRQGEAQSLDGTLDGGFSPTGSPDPSLSGTGGAGGVAPLPSSLDAGTPSRAPSTAPSPLPATGGAGDAGTGPRFAPGAGSSAPGSTGTALPGTGGDGGASTGAGGDRSAQAQPAQGTAVQPGDDGAGVQETDPAGTVSVGAVDIEGPPSAATPEEAAAALREQVQALQQREAALTARQEELAQQAQALQARVAAAEARAQELEAARVERLAALEEVGALLVDVDTALAVGESDVENPMAAVLEALAAVQQSAEESGQGETVLGAERAQTALATVMDAVGRRDTYAARLAIQAAAESIRAARRSALDQAEGALLTPR